MEPFGYFLLAALLVAAGLVGTIVPVLPGPLIVFAGLALAAWAEDFTRVGWVALSIIGALGLASLLADFVGTLLGARRVGASPMALAGAAIGGVVGLFFGIPGLLLGPFFGAVAGELLARGRLLQAGVAGFGTWLGLLLAAIAKLLLGLLMIAVFLIARAMHGG